MKNNTGFSWLQHTEPQEPKELDMKQIELSHEEREWMIEVIQSEYVLAIESQKFHHAKMVQNILDALED